MNKAYSMLGLANKAGMLVTGEDAVRYSIRNGKVKLAIVSEDASDNTKKRFINSAAFYKVPLITWGLKEELGNSIGKSERSVLGITDENFSKNFKEKLTAEVIKNEKPGGALLE
ncbi:MAG TPA: ribosomal L7Ae/L30e/S12e/Gadd45 family protein [Clostridia bacterium]|nr:ribosomal L7Ae/L30e/S12e/Gadd45 family protein [Clostridia bacterium]